MTLCRVLAENSFWEQEILLQCLVLWLTDVFACFDLSLAVRIFDVFVIMMGEHLSREKCSNATQEWNFDQLFFFFFFDKTPISLNVLSLLYIAKCFGWSSRRRSSGISHRPPSHSFM